MSYLMSFLNSVISGAGLTAGVILMVWAFKLTGLLPVPAFLQ